jgi:hypothetical protein
MSEIEHYIGLILAEGYDEEDAKSLVGVMRNFPSVDYAVLMANEPKVEKPEPTREQLGIIGRERALIDKLTKALRAGVQAQDQAISDWTPETKRGSYFEVMIHVDGEPTGHVARVTVELDRFDPDLLEAYQREQGNSKAS